VRDIVDLHEEILRAIADHQPSEAPQEMRIHIDDSRDNMVRLFTL
jgi:DNA-binding GntR family transcriptional regulator